MARRISWDRAWEIARDHDWTREDLAEDFAEWLEERREEEPEEIEGLSEDQLWDEFFESSTFERCVERYAEQIQDGDF